MDIFHKPFDQIGFEDLKNLLIDQVPEGKTIEYKSEPNIKKDSEKKEFLADVSSFANTIGGLIIFGIKEKKGIPVEVNGFECEDIDAEILRLESMILTGLQPRISGISSRYIKMDNGNLFLLMHIPNSYASPHIISYQNSSKFFARNSAGKYQLDVFELRTAFLLSETLNEKVRNFRLDRIAKINSGETPVVLRNNPKIVLHFLPLISFNSISNVNLNDIVNEGKLLDPVYISHNDSKYNFDGFVTYRIHDNNLSSGYLQIFRNGCLETIDTRLLRAKGDAKIIPSKSFEEGIADALARYMILEKKMKIDFPYVVILSLINVKGYKMGVKTSFSSPFIDEDITIDRDILLLPDIQINVDSVDPFRIMKPVFDSVWNACGYAGSTNYDQNNNWIAN